ncbi:MAG: DUF1573 domain-containing protein [Ignavibacteria bacterium]|nr:DUF1573 domain-containing protein [Ignavibacteria bacterium]
MKTGKILFLVAGIILVIAFSAFLINKNLSDPKYHPPKIKFSQERIDLGTVKQGPQVHGEFEFTNEGESVLHILKIQPACGCTGVVADEKKEYQPGEKGKIKFSLNTEGRSGHQEKTITIESNDPLSPTKVVTFVCNIVTE